MTPVEALSAVTQAGVVLAVNPAGQLTACPPGRLAPEVKAALATHKAQLVAVYQLREVHRRMGFSEADVFMIEAALLSGAVSEIRIAVRPPDGAVA